MILLEGSRIYLREFNLPDWVGVHAYASQERVCRFQPWGPNDEEQSKSFVKQVMVDAEQMPRTRFVFAIVERATEKMIGAGEFNIRSMNDRSGEIGYIVNPDYWGQGIATETAKLLVNFGFEESQMHRIYATCDPRNVGSSKVLTKIGMTQEGRLRDVLLIKDGWRDSFVFSILEHEWKAGMCNRPGA
ncbi:GNAT family N-acetyltransferase [Paenibacillus sp. UNC451MF]|uniref:GNAT family N-acetyltransferase n=1 Tax=Paenibacillus sp. UNC451MF TaxID=1449063 RepID=UPI000B2D0D29|nr:GNAT family protein [Paenibacillus sp. UNC451MF]